MVHELDVQIDVVEGKITKVEGEIDEVKGQLKLVDQLEVPELREVRRAELLEEMKRLGTKEEQLRKEKEDLRAKETLLLTAKLQPPGVVPLLFVFIVHAQPASLQAASSALCTRFCLLSLALAAIGFIYLGNGHKPQPVETEHCQFKVFHSPPWIGCSAWLCLMRFLAAPSQVERAALAEVALVRTRLPGPTRLHSCRLL